MNLKYEHGSLLLAQEFDETLLGYMADLLLLKFCEEF